MSDSADGKWDEFKKWAEDHGFEPLLPEDWDEDAEGGETESP